MLAAVSEEILLREAVAAGLLQADVVAAVSTVDAAQPAFMKWGRILDRLIADGVIADSVVEQLAAEIAVAYQSKAALAQTMDGESVAGLAADRGSALDQTMPSMAGGAATATVTVARNFPAPHWDKYEFLEILGRGGMGTVYKATDRRLGRLVALKFIHGEDGGMIQRFLQEARAQARLDHPHICKVYEVGTVDGKPYIAMELVVGQTLDHACALLTMTEKLQLLKDAAGAVHAAHEQGVIHRDLKPSTVTIERENRKTVPRLDEVFADHRLWRGTSERTRFGRSYRRSMGTTCRKAWPSAWRSSQASGRTQAGFTGWAAGGPGSER